MAPSRKVSYAMTALLLSAGAPLGLLVLRALTAPDRALARDVAENAAVYAYIALSTAVVFTTFGCVLGHKADQLAALSMTDGLTGLLNARGFHESLKRELDRSGRSGEPLALLLIDLDRLKRINDAGGHPAGDAALRRVADAIRGNVRSSDSAARIGGDEFAVLAPATGLDVAVRAAERIRSLASSQDRTGSPVTVSIGVAIHDAAEPCASSTLLERADRALYQAKAAGRDRVVRFEEPAA